MDPQFIDTVVAIEKRFCTELGKLLRSVNYTNKLKRHKTINVQYVFLVEIICKEIFNSARHDETKY